MAEIGIDQSKLPGVKEVPLLGETEFESLAGILRVELEVCTAELAAVEVKGGTSLCRDFAVLEDHTLAHSLQEQEIEHHLATNVQRNRLVQHDMQIARLLQEEEDRKAQACSQERRKDIERQDCEIAQEIQVKLVIEAEQQRRRQEEDDEDIARILQQKELREEKRRKKPPAEPLLPGPYEKGFHPDSRGTGPSGPLPPSVLPNPVFPLHPVVSACTCHFTRVTNPPPLFVSPICCSDHPCDSHGQETPACRGSPQPRRGDRQPREHRRGPPLVPEGLDLEVLGSSSSEGRKAKAGQRHSREKRDRQPGSREPAVEPEGGGFDRGSSRCTDYREGEPGAPRGPAGFILDGELECADRGRGGSRERPERRPRSRERTRGLPPPAWDKEGEGPSLDYDPRRRKHQERPGRSRRPPSPGIVVEDRNPSRRRSSSRSPNAARQRLPRESPLTPRTSRQPGLQDPEELDWQGPRKDAGRGRARAGHGARAFPRRGEDWETDPGRQRSPGTKSREAAHQKPRPAAQEQEFYDAEIARKLQEEELLASQVDKRAAQVAQDEEIARLLMAEEKKAYKKAKDREKGSLEKKRREQDWKVLAVPLRWVCVADTLLWWPQRDPPLVLSALCSLKPTSQGARGREKGRSLTGPGATNPRGPHHPSRRTRIICPDLPANLTQRMKHPSQTLLTK
ncbi:hypothetical protein lerEdw1_005103, partial [Lerista edwardsae]